MLSKVVEQVEATQLPPSVGEMFIPPLKLLD